MIIKINREIASEDDRIRLWFECGRDCVSFDQIDEAISYMDPADDTIELHMNSLGGDCDEGFMIYDKLRATGKKIKAVIQGKCASMASVILLAASERTAFPHASLLIHKPYLSFSTSHFSLSDAENYKAQLEDLTEKILSIYEERTGTARAVLEPLMDADQEMSAEKAMELGFIHTILTPASASAYTNQLPKTKKMAKQEKVSNSLRDRILKSLGLSMKDVKASDLVLEAEDGTQITVDIPDGDELKVGDPASPDGTFTLTDGRTVTIEGGVITEIQTSEEVSEAKLKEKDEEIARLKEENEKLKENNAALEQSKANAKTEADIEALDFVTKAGGLDKLRQMASSYSVQSRRHNDTTHEPEKKSMLREEIEKKMQKRSGKQTEEK